MDVWNEFFFYWCKTRLSSHFLPLDHGTSGSSSAEDGNLQLNRGVVCSYWFMIPSTLLSVYLCIFKVPFTFFDLVKTSMWSMSARVVFAESLRNQSWCLAGVSVVETKQNHSGASTLRWPCTHNSFSSSWESEPGSLLELVSVQHIVDQFKGYRLTVQVNEAGLM